MEHKKFRVLFEDKWRYFIIGQSWTEYQLAVYNQACLLGLTFYQSTGLKANGDIEIFVGDIIGYSYTGGDKKGQLINQLEVKYGIFNIGSNGFEYDNTIIGPYVEDEYMYGLMIDGGVVIVDNVCNPTKN